MQNMIMKKCFGDSLVLLVLVEVLRSIYRSGAALSDYKLEFMVAVLAVFITNLSGRILLWCLLGKNTKILKYSGYRKEMKSFSDFSEAFCSYAQKNHIDISFLKKVAAAATLVDTIFLIFFVITIW